MSKVEQLFFQNPANAWAAKYEMRSLVIDSFKAICSKY